VLGAAGQIHLVGAMFNNAAAPRARARARGRASACVQCVHLAPRPLARPTIYVRRSPPTSSIFISTEGRAVCPEKDGGREGRGGKEERERERGRGGGRAAVLHPETRLSRAFLPPRAFPLLFPSTLVPAFRLPGYPSPPTPMPSPS